MDDRVKPDGRGGKRRGAFHKDTGFAAETTKDIRAFDKRRRRPWEADEYESVRRAATELVRSHYSVDGFDDDGNEVIHSAISGPLLWALIGALDRDRFQSRGRA